MTDVIEKMCAAWTEEVQRHYDKPVGMIAMDVMRRDAMRAAIAALADNVSDEMVDAFLKKQAGLKSRPLKDRGDNWSEQSAASEKISAALRSLLQN